MKKIIEFLLVILCICVPLESYGQNRFADYKDCSSYGVDYQGNPKRVFLEAQSWWVPMDNRTKDHHGNDVDDFGHVHSGVCFPLNDQISGEISFKLLMTVHNFDPQSRLDFVKPHIYASTQRTGSNRRGIQPVTRVRATSAVGATLLNGGIIRNLINDKNSNDVRRPTLATLCELEGQAGAATCQLGYDFVMDTNLLPYNGLQEFRFFISIREPDGQEMHVSTSFYAVINNPGKDFNNTAEGYNNIEGRGWYTGVNYISSRIYDFEPRKAVDLDTFRPRIETRKGKTQGGVISRSTVHLNPNFHMNNPGVVILGPVNGPVDDFINMKDFEHLLVDGTNKIVIKTESFCDLANGTALDDCDCDTNARAPAGYQGDEIECTQKVLFDNDSQKVQGLMVMPFIYDKPIPNEATISFQQSNVAVTEPASGVHYLNIKVVSDAPVTSRTEILYKPRNGTARHQDGDYGYVSSNKDHRKIFIEAGESETNMIVRIKQDNVTDPGESFLMRITDVVGGNATLGAPSNVTVNISEK